VLPVCSQGLKNILRVILGVGNYLNGSTFRGGAFGFKLSSLPELLAVKANDGKVISFSSAVLLLVLRCSCSVLSTFPKMISSSVTNCP
jgi:hypothetical protein